MRYPSRILASALWAVLALSVRAASATTLLPGDFDTMVAQSHLIVHGRVVDVRSELIGSRRTIESVITVTVIERLKGQAGREVMFHVPGGTVGRYRRVFVGAPSFAAGDEVVLFLRGRAPAIPMPFGLSQGVYRVLRRTGNALVLPVPPLEGIAGTLRGDPARRPLPLPDFMRQVRAIAEATR